MKAFSPAGVAVKAFFGYGAPTFGNPTGAKSGSGGPDGTIPPPPPTPPPFGPLVWTNIASPSGGVTLVGVTSDGAGRNYIADELGNVFVSLTGGATWAPTATPNCGTSGDGNLHISNGGVLIYGGGNAAEIARSTNQGATWTNPATNPLAGGAFTVIDDSTGRWVGWANTSGVANNHSYSIDGGATWTTPGAGGIPGNIGLAALTPGALFYDGAHFVATLNGEIATSADAATWFRQTIIANAIGIALIGGKYICGVGGATSAYVAVSPTIAGLATATGTPLPFPSQIQPCTIAGIAAKNVYVCANSVGECANAKAPNGTWVACNLNFTPGEQVVQIIYDPVSSNFIAVGANGSLSYVHIP